MHIFLIRISLTILTLYGLTGSGTAFAAQAPDFTLDGQQKQIQLSDYHGKIVYLDFWASWCQPCRQSFIWMNKMQSLYGNKNFKVIAINLDESRTNADKFLKRIPAGFDVAFDPHGNIAKTYKVKAMPSSYIIDKQGRLVYINPGFHSNDEDKLEEKIKNLLRQTTLASR